MKADRWLLLLTLLMSTRSKDSQTSFDSKSTMTIHLVNETALLIVMRISLVMKSRSMS